MIFEYKGKMYPEVIRNGDAVAYIERMALEFCRGDGLDIGATKEWRLQGARGVNPDFFDEFDAMNLPPGKIDFIFSSHCLEHLKDPIGALMLWRDKLKEGRANGWVYDRAKVLFLYLPHPDMEYWLPQNNRKHLHSWSPDQMRKILVDLGFSDVISSERDLYWSFAVVGWI